MDLEERELANPPKFNPAGEVESGKTKIAFPFWAGCALSSNLVAAHILHCIWN